MRGVRECVCVYVCECVLLLCATHFTLEGFTCTCAGSVSVRVCMCMCVSVCVSWVPRTSHTSRVDLYVYECVIVCVCIYV